MGIGTFSKVLAVGFAFIAALGGCVLVYGALGELLQRKPMDHRHTRGKQREERAISLWK
jgi:hypothetical protein